jgi:DNA-binding transcriptional regulator YhcF (GntR family)
VQVIDVLRDDADLGVVLPGCDGAMTVVGLDGADQIMTPEIPAPDPFGIALPTLNTGQLVGIELGPQAILVVAERRHAAFRGDSCAGQHRDTHLTKIAGLRDTEQVELGEWLRVDGQADRPLFEQLRSQIIEAIRAGTLPPGSRLPTVRELAGELGLAVNTVARAYRELESAGVVETRGRFGTFVARADPSDSAMAAAARTYLDVARGLGLGKADALGYLEAYEDD